MMACAGGRTAAKRSCGLPLRGPADRHKLTPARTGARWAGTGKGWREGHGHVPVQMLLLATVSVCFGAVSDCAWGLAASGVRAWFARSPRRFALVGGAGGLAMIAVGVSVALTGRKD